MTQKKTKRSDYSEKKFVDDLWQTMKSQEKKNPALGILHEMVDGSIQLVGLTGGIACGKSLISQLFLNKQIPVIDADQIARDIVEPKKKAYISILKNFGPIIIKTGKEKGHIDRIALGKIVFENFEKRKVLESITHPEIRKEISKLIRRYKKEGHKIIVLDAALLFESGLDHLMSQVVVVSIDPDTQIKRLIARDKISENDALKKIQSQMSTREKAQKATFVIDNSGTRQNTQHQFEEIFLQLAGSLHTRLK